MSKFRELPAAIVGQLGEQIVARDYRRDGWGVIASYKFSGQNDNEAPAIELEEGEKEITPDLDLSKGGQRIWVEVKTHETAPRNETLSQRLGHDVFVHGIPVRKFDNYVACEQRTGSAVYLAVVQLDTREILVSPVPISQLPRSHCLCGCRSRSKERCTARWHRCADCKSLGRACRAHANLYPQWYFDKALFQVRGHIDDRTFTILDEKHRALKADIEEKIAHVWRRHGSSREKAPAGPLSYVPWTWACLHCNKTGTGDSSTHRCADPQPALRDYWTRRLKFAGVANAADLVARPIDRVELARFLGPSWLPSGDVV